MYGSVVMILPALLLSLLQVSSSFGASSSRHTRSTDSKVDLDALKESLASIEDGLSHFRKRSCAVGLNSHHCVLASMEDVMKSAEYLSGGYSPGKRNTALPEDVKSRAETLLSNLSEQIEDVSALRRLLNELEQRDHRLVKRTCNFRLGNHCLTEALDKAASQYYYLQSPHSPGRRRRQAPDTASQDDLVSA